MSGRLTMTAGATIQSGLICRYYDSPFGWQGIELDATSVWLTPQPTGDVKIVGSLTLTNGGIVRTAMLEGAQAGEQGHIRARNGTTDLNFDWDGTNFKVYASNVLVKTL